MTIDFRGKFSPANALNVVAWVNSHLTDITVADDYQRFSVGDSTIIKLNNQSIEIYSMEKEGK